MVAEGVIFNIQRYSLDDGPGIRTIVFLKGCPLKCLWCANPEGQKHTPEVAHRDSLCNKCMRCVQVCPMKAISVDAEGIRINRDLCSVCGECAKVCNREALGIYGKSMTVEEVFEEVIKDVDFYKKSNGGVTASGGEPLFQSEFTAALFKKCLEAGIGTVLETSGYAEEDNLKKVLSYTDLVLYDLKCADPKLHIQLTGVSNNLILKNLSIASNLVPLIIRVPVIPNCNDSQQEVEAMAQIIIQNGIDKVELMPYHRFGMGKYKMLDRNYFLEELERPSDGLLQKVKEIFESYGLACKIVA